MIDQLSVFLENKSGRLAELCRILGDARINMQALMVADTAEFGVIRIICDSPQEAERLLDDKGFAASITRVLAIEIPDRPGGLAGVLELLDGKGLNVEYAYCFVEPAGEAAVDVFRVDDDSAEDVLAEAGFKLLSAEDVSPSANSTGP